MTCPLCMFVASKLKERIADPVTQEDIHQASLDACGALPQGEPAGLPSPRPGKSCMCWLCFLQQLVCATSAVVATYGSCTELGSN